MHQPAHKYQTCMKKCEKKNRSKKCWEINSRTNLKSECYNERLSRTMSKTYSITHFSVNRNFVIQLKPVTLIYCLHWHRLRHAWHVSHLTGPISHVDLGHVGHIPQALHAVSVPGSHWFWQDLELQILPLPQILAMCLKMHKSVNEDEKIFYSSMMSKFLVPLLLIMYFNFWKFSVKISNMWYCCVKYVLHVFYFFVKMYME